MEYLDFIDGLTERTQIKARIETDRGVVEQEEKLRKAALIWWKVIEPRLIELPKTKQLMKLRAELLTTFEAAVRPIGLLDRFKTMGVIVSWWDEAYEVSADLKRLASLGFKGLIESWVESIRDEVEDDEKRSGPKADPLGHKIVRVLVPEYLEELSQAEATIATLEQEKEAFEQGEESEADEEGETINYAKQLEDQLKELKFTIKDFQKRLKELLASSRKKGSIEFEKKQGNDTTALEQELADLQTQVEPIEREIAGIEERLQPYKETLEELKEARKQLKQLKAALIKRLQEACVALSNEDAQRLGLDWFRKDLMTQLERYIAEHRQLVVVAVENWWDKYKVTLGEIEREEEALEQKLSKLLRSLGYERDN